MTGQEPKSEEFTQALGEEVDSAFKKLIFLILKEGALSAKDKALIALACSVAVRCEHCVKRHKGGGPQSRSQPGGDAGGSGDRRACAHGLGIQRSCSPAG